jgi:hypothetical protein
MFPYASSRSTGGDSGGGYGAGGCVVPNPKTFLGVSLISYVFDALQEIKFPTDDVENLRIKGGITLNSGRCRAGLFATMPSDSGKISFPQKPDHGGRGVAGARFCGGGGFGGWQRWF